MAISVLAFVVVEAVVAGFTQDLRAKVLGFSSHLTLVLPSGERADPSLLQKIKDKAGVTGVSRFADGEAILQTEEDDATGIRVRGIDPEWIAQNFGDKVRFEEGEDWDSLKGTEHRAPGIIVGIEVASNLSIVPLLMEPVQVLYPFGEVGPTGEVEPNIRSFRVIGTFKTGYFEYDNKFALVDLSEAKRLFGEDLNERVGVFVDDPMKVDAWKSTLSSLASFQQVQTWEEQHSRLFSALKLEKLGMTLVLALMSLLASFNILSMLMMVVFERRREISVLKALGMSSRKIAGIFYRAGLSVGLFGGFAGIVMGYALCRYLNQAHLKLPAPYYIEDLPILVNPWVLAGTFCLAVLLSLLATIFPARQGSRLTIVEALKND